MEPNDPKNKAQTLLMKDVTYSYTTQITLFIELTSAPDVIKFSINGPLPFCAAICNGVQ